MSFPRRCALAEARDASGLPAATNRVAKKPRIPEFVLHAAWRRARWARTRKGQIYRILYPGRPGGGAGPDFKDAVLVSPQGLPIRGDVEIHVRPAEWFGHGHDADEKYNGVAFHVSPDHDGSRPATTRSGILIPLLLLPAARGKGDARRRAAYPERGVQGADQLCKLPRGADLGSVPQISLAEAGELRFLARSAGFALELRTSAAEEVVWRAVLECLGYAQNRRGFRVLGVGLPWKELRRCLLPGIGEEAAAELLLWAAGFEPFPPKLQAGRPPRLHGRRPRWRLPGGRPDNHPARRIRGAAALAIRFVEGGGPAATLARWASTSKKPSEFLARLRVPSAPPDRRALIGPGRAAEISINAVLPAMHALASRDERWHLAEASLGMYRKHPKLPENGITREMRRVMASLGRSDPVAGAREQQGLIYLYRVMTHGAVAHRGDASD